MIPWIYRPFGCEHIAYMCVGDGYIPFSPHGGRHVMDDFGNLVMALPGHYYMSARYAGWAEIPAEVY